MEKKVAILTPTYNRAYILGKLYLSLLEQSSKDFVWYIVDDGSTDDTESLVKSFSTHDFQIQYIKKRNGGKHTALNAGINIIREELTIIVDSDDTLTIDAIETICKDWGKYSKMEKICGLSYYRLYPDNQVIGDQYPDDYIFDTYTNLRVNQHISGDKAEVYTTKILRDHPFPEIKEERFLSEAIVWNGISKDGYKLMYISRGIYICQYREDGLSYAGRKLMLNNPRGGALHAKSFIFNDVKKWIQFKYMILYVCMNKFAGNSIREAIKDLPNRRSLFFTSLIPGNILAFYWKIKFYR